ncbi:MAG: hypothetical protein NTY99_02405 [DPANN group archaeon]|nr:hypothetical protein [DPANN group archaeon]
MDQEQKPFAYRVKEREGPSKVFQTLPEMISVLKVEHILPDWITVHACYAGGKEELVPQDKYAKKPDMTEEEAGFLVRSYKATYKNLESSGLKRFFYEVMIRNFNLDDPEEKQVKDMIKNCLVEWLNLEDIVS